VTSPNSEATVLFVCTGNIFRSMTAEYALRKHLTGGRNIHVHSAGLIDAPHEIVSFVKEYLSNRDIDISKHLPRKLTEDMLSSSDLVVAMDLEHREQLRDQFECRAPLFSEVVDGTEKPLLDVCEVVENWLENEEKAKEYGWSVMDTIYSGMPQFLDRMSSYMRP